MNKADLIRALEERLGSRKAATDALEAVVDVVIREVARGGKVAITGFGTFEKAARAARTGRNPRTGEAVRIDQTMIPRFRAGTAFKEVVANPRALPKAALAGTRAAAGTAGSLARGGSRSGGATTSSAKRAAKPGAAASSPAKKATAKKATTKKTTTKKTTTKKATAGKTTAKGASTARATARRSTATKGTAQAAPRTSTPKKAAPRSTEGVQ